MAFSQTSTLTRSALVGSALMERSESESDMRKGRYPYRVFGSNTVISSPPASEAEFDTGQVLLQNEKYSDKLPLNGVLKDEEFLNFPARQVLREASTPPIPIANSRAASRSASRLREFELAGNNDANATNQQNGTKPAGSTRRRKKKRGPKPTVMPAEPATKTVRGFAPTPNLSTDEDSDFSVDLFKRRDISLNASGTSTPFLRPASRTGSVTGGISALRQQLDRLNVAPVSDKATPPRAMSQNQVTAPNSPGATSRSASGCASDSDPTELTSYEIPLTDDFISHDANDVHSSREEEVKSPNVEQMSLVDDVHRKMTAEDFTPVLCLGQGTFGTVHLVKQVKTGKLYAQKMFRKASITVHKTLVEQTKTERTILESINRHPFVVKLYYAFQDKEKLYLILEYASGGELFTHLANERMFPEDTAAFYMAELALALEHLHHTIGVVYRDLKPENCLLDAEGHLLLTDFGLSKVAVDSADRCTSILGTVEYMAPEVILGRAYGTAVDWWSFGALGYDLLTGSPPFTANNRTKIQEKIVKSKLVMPYFLGPDAKDLLTRLLRKEPSKRLGGNTPRDLVTIKRHRFFRRIDWALLEKRQLDPPIRPLITDPELAENFAAEFTGMALSTPGLLAEKADGIVGCGSPITGEGSLFGGFSFVASRSLLAENYLDMLD